MKTGRVKHMASVAIIGLLILTLMLSGCAGQGKREDAQAVQIRDVLTSDQAEIKLQDIQIRSRMGKASEGQDDSMVYLHIFLDVDNKKEKDVKLDRLLRVTAVADGQECEESIVLVNGYRENEKVPAGVSQVEYGFKVPKDSQGYEVSLKVDGHLYEIGFNRGDSIPGQQEVPIGEDFLYGDYSVNLGYLEVSDDLGLGKVLSTTGGLSSYMSVKVSRENYRILHLSGTMKNESDMDWDKNHQGWEQMLLTAEGDVYYGKMVDKYAETFQIKAGEEKEFHLMFDVPEDLEVDGIQMMLYEDNAYTYVDRNEFSDRLNEYLAAPDGTAIASAGQVNGNTYTNSYLGLTMTAPDGYELFGPEEIAAVTGNESNMEKNQEDWDIGYLFFMTDPTSELSFIQAEAVPLRVLKDSATGEEFITTYIESSAFMGGFLNQSVYKSDARESLEISGRQIAFTQGNTKFSQIRPPFGSISCRSGYGAFVENGYVILFQSLAMDDESLERAMAAIKGISFTDTSAE